VPLVDHERGRRLAGGNVGGAIRIGDTVRRAAGPWTRTIHALLAHLRDNGFGAVPVPCGVDDQGREVLRYVAGEVPSGDRVPDWARSDEALADIAQLIRRFHDASQGFPPAGATWQHLPGALSGDEVICHNDLAPYNTVYASRRPIAFIDWDFASPGMRTWDVAHAAWRFIPLGSQMEVAEAARRLRLFCDAYGLRERATLIDVIASRQQALHDTIREFAARGLPAFVAMWETTHSEQPLHDRRHVLAHRAAYEAALK
jgi:hypothetical protein